MFTTARKVIACSVPHQFVSEWLSASLLLALLAHLVRLELAVPLLLLQTCCNWRVDPALWQPAPTSAAALSPNLRLRVRQQIRSPATNIPHVLCSHSALPSVAGCCSPYYLSYCLLHLLPPFCMLQSAATLASSARLCACISCSCSCSAD